MTRIDPAKTALLLIGFQKDYFDPTGVLYSVVEESSRVSGILSNTVELIEAFKDTEMTMINTPIVFSEAFSELKNPIGILKTIRDVEAFKIGTPGAETIPQIARYGDRITTVMGKKSFDAFTNTNLASLPARTRSRANSVCRMRHLALRERFISTRLRCRIRCDDPVRLHLQPNACRAGFLLQERVPALCRSHDQCSDAGS